MKSIAIIPARYASTRFPGKPLALLDGKPIIQHVYARVAPLFDRTIVATDDDRIASCVQTFGGEAAMTSEKHRSGTDRCREAYDGCGESFDVIVNVQGDEPFITSSQLSLLKACFSDEQTQIATLVKPFSNDATLSVLQNPNSPKVIVSQGGFALYFSRSIIPYVRNVAPAQWLRQHTFYKHIGIYGFRSSVLKEVTQLPPSPLEQAESLEQLRWLDNGYRIKVGITKEETIGIDTPEDLEMARLFLHEHSNS